MFASTPHARCEPQQSFLAEASSFENTHRSDSGLPFGERAGLIHNERVDFGERLKSFSVAHQNTCVRAAANGNHNGHRRRQPKRAWARDDQYGHSRHQRVRKTRLWAEQDPACKREDCNGDHRRDKISRDAVGKSLQRRAAALRFADEFHNLRQHRFAAYALRFHDETAAGVQRSTGDFIASTFFDWHGFAGHHGFIDGARAFENGAIHGDALARAYTKFVATFYLIERDITLRAVSRKQVSLPRRKIQKRANGSTGALPGAQFQYLPEENESGDHRRRFEINRRGAIHSAERGRKHLGEESSDNAFEVRGAGAQPDQRKHVRAAIDERGPKTLEEWPSTPKNCRRGKKKLDSISNAGRQMDADQVPKHGKEQQRKRQHRADPETQQHGLVLGVGFHLRENVHRFEGHAANWAAPWTHLNDLRMHRTGVTNRFFVSCHAGRGRLWAMRRPVFRRRGTVVHSCNSGRSEKLLRLARKPFGTTFRAEVIHISSMLGLSGGILRSNRHSADGILHLWRRS